MPVQYADMWNHHLTSPLGRCSPPDSILITPGAKRGQISDFWVCKLRPRRLLYRPLSFCIGSPPNPGDEIGGWDSASAERVKLPWLKRRALLGTDRRESSTPSCSSSRSLAAMPPAYPVRLPPEPTTRWQGMMMRWGCGPPPPTAWLDMEAFPSAPPAPGQGSIGRGFSVGYLAQQPPYPLSELPPMGHRGGSGIGFSQQMPGQSAPRQRREARPAPPAPPHGSPKYFCPSAKADQVLPSLPSVSIPSGDGQAAE